MDHREYIRIVPGSRWAVLMLHGIGGTPAHFRDLLPLIPADWSVYNLLLDGHGGSVEDFGRTSMAKWKRQVQTRLDELLARHEKLVLIAHSMGTLFSIRAAIEHPDRIARLFLLAVPTRPWIRFSTMLTCLRVTQGKIHPQDKAALDLYNATSIRMDRRLWKYVTWIPRMIELLLEICRIRRLLPRLAVPCQTFQSHTDELVSRRSCKDLETHPAIQNTVLYDSGHFAYGPEDTKLLQTRLAETLRQLP